jgi:hypothetical protein
MDILDYKIPKVEVSAYIALDNGLTFEQDEYVIFLDQFSRYRKAEQSIYEFLNSKNGFIPLKNCVTGEFLIVNINDVVYVKEKEKFIAQYERKIKLQLENNFLLEVDHINPLPDSHSRVLDYLNQETDFLLFYYDERKIFINKKKILRVKDR